MQVWELEERGKDLSHCAESLSILRCEEMLVLFLCVVVVGIEHFELNIE